MKLRSLFIGACALAGAASLAACGEDEEPDGRLAHAFEVCVSDRDDVSRSLAKVGAVARLADEGRSLVISPTREPVFVHLAADATTCILDETNGPDSLAAKMEQGKRDGGEDNYDGITITWSPASGGGQDVVFELSS